MGEKSLLTDVRIPLCVFFQGIYFERNLYPGENNQIIRWSSSLSNATNLFSSSQEKLPSLTQLSPWLIDDADTGGQHIASSDSVGNKTVTASGKENTGVIIRKTVITTQL